MCVHAVFMLQFVHIIPGIQKVDLILPDEKRDQSSSM